MIAQASTDKHYNTLTSYGQRTNVNRCTACGTLCTAKSTCAAIYLWDGDVHQATHALVVALIRSKVTRVLHTQDIEAVFLVWPNGSWRQSFFKEDITGAHTSATCE